MLSKFVSLQNYAYLCSVNNVRNHQNNYMTAIVAVLNKHAVAIAADSAVTMGNTHKVVNSANKIFTLSKYHPVAVMTYNFADFMGTPWDIIIKEYRRQLEERSFPTLHGYVNDFFQFLARRDFFCDSQTKEKYFGYFLDTFFKAFKSSAAAKNKVGENNVTESMLIQELEEYKSKININIPQCADFNTYSLDEFRQDKHTYIENFAVQNKFSAIELLEESFHLYIVSEIMTEIFTGLVFVGYGEDEIYPSLLPFYVSPIVLGRRLKYFVDINKECKINEHGPYSVICPFAQTDVTQTIICGMNPYFNTIISQAINSTLSGFTATITKILDRNPQTCDLSNIIKGLDLGNMAEDAMKQINKEIEGRYTTPLLNTVINLDKEDMADMAESFISLTSLVRRMQPGEETVGGPVDVAVISKGDGFVWIKRKHYFKPELNTSFFNNYFK